MYCLHCGSFLHSNVNFCPYCGAKQPEFLTEQFFVNENNSAFTNPYENTSFSETKLEKKRALFYKSASSAATITSLVVNFIMLFLKLLGGLVFLAATIAVLTLDEASVFFLLSFICFGSFFTGIPRTVGLFMVKSGSERKSFKTVKKGLLFLEFHGFFSVLIGVILIFFYLAVMLMPPALETPVLAILILFAIICFFFALPPLLFKLMEGIECFKIIKALENEETDFHLYVSLPIVFYIYAALTIPFFLPSLPYHISYHLFYNSVREAKMSDLS